MKGSLLGHVSDMSHLARAWCIAVWRDRYVARMLLFLPECRPFLIIIVTLRDDNWAGGSLLLLTDPDGPVMKSICITQVPRYVLYSLYLAARDAEWDVMDVDGTVEQNRDDDGIIELYFLLLSPFFYFYLLFFFIFINFFLKNSAPCFPLAGFLTTHSFKDGLLISVDEDKTRRTDGARKRKENGFVQFSLVSPAQLQSGPVEFLFFENGISLPKVWSVGMGWGGMGSSWIIYNTITSATLLSRPGEGGPSPVYISVHTCIH